MNTFEKIGKLLVDLIKTGGYGELTFNCPKPQYPAEDDIVYKFSWAQLSGYCGYEAMTLSRIENREEVKQLIELLKQITR